MDSINHQTKHRSFLNIFSSSNNISSQHDKFSRLALQSWHCWTNTVQAVVERGVWIEYEHQPLLRQKAYATIDHIAQLHIVLLNWRVSAYGIETHTLLSFLLQFLASPQTTAYFCQNHSRCYRTSALGIYRHDINLVSERRLQPVSSIAGEQQWDVTGKKKYHTNSLNIHSDEITSGDKVEMRIVLLFRCCWRR